MAVLFSGSGQQYSSTAGIPTTRLFTILCWVYPVTFSNAAQIFWSLESSSTQYATFGYDSTGHLFFDWSGPGQSFTVGTQTLPAGTWYCLGAIINGTSARIYHGLDPGNFYEWVETGNFQLPTGTLSLTIGGSAYFSSSAPNIRMSSFKMYDAALDTVAMSREWSTHALQRSDNINRWYQFLTSETVDYSGNGRTLSGGSGTAAAAGPPIPWRNQGSVTPYQPWSPGTEVWYAHYDTTTGELLSVGTVLPSPLPAGTAALELLGQPDLSRYVWDTSARTFVLMDGIPIIDRIDDLAADASLASVWTTLDATQDQALKDRIAQLLGPNRYRYDFQPVDLE